MQGNTDKLTRKLKIARGQIDGILKMIEEDRYCVDVSTQLMAVISALKGVNRDVLSNHLHHCVHTTMTSKDETEVTEKLEEIVVIIDKLSK